MQSKHPGQNRSIYLCTLFLSFIFISTSPLLIADNLTLQQAEKIALNEEPGLISQHWKARSLMEKAIADSQLMDPKLQIALSNFPTDSFDFGQEAMTQFKVSYLQQFPSGDTLELNQQKTVKQSELIQSAMANRNLTILKDVRLTYLEAYYWEQAKKTILKNKKLFTQLVEIVQSLFAVGRNDQQDLIRAQLELSRLDDRLAKIEQNIMTQRSRLSRWVGMDDSSKNLSVEIPDLPDSKLKGDFESLSEYFQQHPKIQQVDKQIEITRKDIELVEESLSAGWGLNVSYGYRGDDPAGNDRSDFISAAATIDLPFFTKKRQDKKRLSREHEYQSLKNKRLEVLRQLVSELQQEMANETLLLRRQKLYQDLLLPQAKQQTQASLLAYQSDRGSFADVMRAYMDDLNANLDDKRIAIDRRKAQAKILYLVPAFSQKIQTEFR